MLIIKCPLSQGSLNKNIGTETAPAQILEELKNYEYNENKQKIIFNSEEILISNNLTKNHSDIYSKIKEINEKAIIIGGDHSITFSSFKAFSERHSNVSLIVLDAHPDLEISSFNEPTHEDYLRMLIENNYLKIDNLVLIGLRVFSKNELDFLDKNKILIYDMKKIFELGIQECADLITEKILTFENIYLSIDIDVLDSSCVPGTGYPEPGGIQIREFIYLIQRLMKIKTVKLIDIVEVNPKKDVNNITSKLAAKIISELI
ncbi:arginase family protein [Candidatus Woesearchaeota archaeon]|nr:arginase family protein [Candidatus Woesearchaeota archaeon]